ncbi:histidine kinase dimerization/phospho-acceptor domain-containing protein, partial [Roseateles sp. GG27B]
SPIEKRAHGAPDEHAPAWLRKAIAQQLPPVNLVVAVGGRDYGVLRLSFSTDSIAAMFWKEAWFALGLALAGLLTSMLLVWRPLNNWLGNLGQIRAFGEQLQVNDGTLAPILTADAPVEFRRTFEALNQAASSLQLERERAALTLAVISDGIATTDAQGRIVFANPVLGQMLALAPQALRGQRIQTLLPDLPADLPAADDWTLRLRASRAGSTPHSACAVLDLRASVIAGPDGHAAGWVLAFRDISQQQALEDRLQAEVQQRATAMESMRAMLQASERERLPAIPSVGTAVTAMTATATTTAAATSNDIAVLLQLVQALLAQLRERGEQLATIFALSPDGFVSFDANQIARYVSPAFARLSGMAAENAVGQHQHVLLMQLLAKGQNEAQSVNFGALRLGKRRIELDRPARRVLELSLHEAAPGGTSEVAQLLHVSDVTHQVEVEQMKSEFLATAAHELRTPMASIYGFTELLLAREVSVERRREVLARIYRQSESMIAILNELLDLARIEARRGKDFELEVLDLKQLVEEVLHDFAPPNDRQSPLLSIGLLTCQINVDRNKLKQVLRNLLSNAYKYSAATGRVWVRLVELPGSDHDWTTGGSASRWKTKASACRPKNCPM